MTVTFERLDDVPHCKQLGDRNGGEHRWVDIRDYGMPDTHVRNGCVFCGAVLEYEVGAMTQEPGAMQ